MRIIGAIERQFFTCMLMHVFDSNNLSQEIVAIDTWRAVICSLGHGRKHMLGDQALVCFSSAVMSTELEVSIEKKNITCFEKTTIIFVTFL